MARNKNLTVSNIPDDELLTATEVAKLLRLGDRTLREKATSGEIPCVRLGRQIRFRPADIRKIIEEGL
jgi:excisionase family DNA binding protein